MATADIMHMGGGADRRGDAAGDGRAVRSAQATPMPWRRGACKMRGGKLVAVSVPAAVQGDNVVPVRIDGDFFAEGDADAAAALIDELAQTIGRCIAADAADAAVSRETATSRDAAASLETRTARLAAAVQETMRQHPRVQLAGADAWTIATATMRAFGADTTVGAPARSFAEPASARMPEPADTASARCDVRDVRDLPGLVAFEDEPREPAMQLALDQACAEAMAAGGLRPMVRFWQWDRSAVVIGRFQSLHSEVNVEQAAAEGVTVVRRITGGGAMFAEPQSVITYSLIAPLDFVAGVDAEESYRICDGWVMAALNGMGIDARYQPINDIASQAGKIGGAAQRRFPAPHGAQTWESSASSASAASGAVLHHTMMSYDMDAAKMLRILNVSREKMSDKAVRSAAKRVDPLRSQTGLPREEIVRRMIDSLNGSAAAPRASDVLPQTVLDRAEALVRERFGTQRWTGIIA